MKRSGRKPTLNGLNGRIAARLAERNAATMEPPPEEKHGGILLLIDRPGRYDFETFNPDQWGEIPEADRPDDVYVDEESGMRWRQMPAGRRAGPEGGITITIDHPGRFLFETYSPRQWRALPPARRPSEVFEDERSGMRWRYLATMRADCNRRPFR